MIRIWCFLCCGLGSIPDRGAEVPQGTQCSQNKTKQKTKRTHTKTDKKIKKLDPGFMTYCVDLTSWQFTATIQKMGGSNKYLCSKIVVRIK